jgi:hypothetical protein
MLYFLVCCFQYFELQVLDTLLILNQESSLSLNCFQNVYLEFLVVVENMEILVRHNFVHQLTGGFQNLAGLYV